MLLKRNHAELVWYRALAELQAEASRAYVGILWWVIEPLLYLLTFYLVFAVGFRVGGEGYAVFLLCGLVPWKWFASTIQTASQTIVTNKGLIQQVYFPKYLLVCSVIVLNTIKYLIILALLLVFLVFNGHTPSATWLAIPFLMMVQLFLMAGLAMLAAALVPLLPELKLVVENGLLLMFFASGIFYDVYERTEAVQNILLLNPMLQVISAYRASLVAGNWPAWDVMALILAGSVTVVIAGLAMLRKFDTEYPKVVV